MYGLEGEELWYADFQKGEGVYPQPDFIDPFRYVDGAYTQAVGDQQVCKFNLGIARQAYKDMEKEIGITCYTLPSD